MTLEELRERPNLKVKLRSGASVVRTKPLFTYNSKCLVIASGYDVKVYSIQSGECIHTLRYHKTRVVSLRESKKNLLQVFSCSEDGIVVRWDHTEGIMLEAYDMQMPVASFYAPTVDNTWFVTQKVKNQDHFRLYSLVPKPQKCENVLMLINPVLPRENCIAFGFERKYVAAVHSNTLTVYNFDTQSTTKHLTGKRLLECVACHPSEMVIATGDNQGRVLVWSNIFDVRKCIKSIYHWHTLPVGDIAFSMEGSYLYSGGGEATLIKWNLFVDEKCFLPRLGAPICQIAVAQDNSYVVTAHIDNSLQVIDSQRKVVQVIQGLTQGHFQGARGKNILPTGLLYDSLTKSLVLNGRPGHLQFYNIHEDKQLLNLDIAHKNLISQEREKVVLNTDVHKAAIDELGFWLATVEYWNDEEISPEIWLKFWEYEHSKKTFVLNTQVYLPHTLDVNCAMFKPRTSPEDEALLVTTSNDCRFNVWVLGVDEGGKQSWTCKSTGCYRDLAAGDACFTEDGSLLAVAFGNVVTIWTVDNAALKVVLTHERNSNNIEQLVFGRKSCSHLLICHNGSSITVWNMLSATISWVAHTEVQILVADVTSTMVAAFCKDQTLIIFQPDDSKPIHCIEKVSNQPIVSAIFVPLNAQGSHFHEKSQLFFFDADQNLLTLVDSSEEEEGEELKKVKIHQNLSVTPFGMLQAESRVTNVEAYEPEDLVEMFTSSKDVQDMSCPTFTDLNRLCSKVLKALLIPAQKTKI